MLTHSRERRVSSRETGISTRETRVSRLARVSAVLVSWDMMNSMCEAMLGFFFFFYLFIQIPQFPIWNIHDWGFALSFSWIVSSSWGRRWILWHLEHFQFVVHIVIRSKCRHLFSTKFGDEMKTVFSHWTKTKNKKRENSNNRMNLFPRKHCNNFKWYFV